MLKQILVQSTRAVFYNKKFLLLFWATNASMSFVLSIPIYSLLLENLQHSVWSDKLATGFDYFWFLQFYNLFKSNFQELPLAFYSIVGLYILIQTFYNGGLISIFNIPKKNHVSDFFYGGVKYWYRLIKVLLISLIFYFLAFKLNGLLGDWLHWSYSPNETVILDFIYGSSRYLLLIFLIILITIISDYTKIYLALNDKQKAAGGIKYILVFLKNNFIIIFILFLIVAIMGAVGAIVYNVIVVFVPKTPFYLLFLTFILQQMLIIFRLSIRMLFCATEVLLYKDLDAEYVSSNKGEING